MRRRPVLAAVAAAVALAAPAHADPGGNDADFVGALNNAGITFRNPQQAIEAGKQVCAMMDDGQSGVDVAKKLTELNPGFALSGAAKFTAIAASAYCPKHLGGSDSEDDK
ncbi:DUF732 domain-containing protein [Mycobacterium sp.]|uniref:DUF732 domain-containing protein n=1 Tax=Mycobacterium sp. TaxID=1785 RepID=UPI003D6C33C6